MVTTLEGVDYPSESKANHTDFSFWLLFLDFELRGVQFLEPRNEWIALKPLQFLDLIPVDALRTTAILFYLFIFLIGISLRGAYALAYASNLTDYLLERIISLRGVFRYGVQWTDGTKPAGPSIPSSLFPP